MPFFVSIVGATLHARGRYRDRVMTTVQAELRAHTKGQLAQPRSAAQVKNEPIFYFSVAEAF